MSNIEEAFECLRFDPIDEDYRVRSGMGSRFGHILDDYIDDETNFDPQQHKISRTTVVQAFHETVLEVAEDTREEDDPDYEELMEAKKGDVLRETIGRDLESFTIVFPLNLREASSIPDSFSAPDADFERIPEDEWRDRYADPAVEADETSLSEFLEESPNDLYEHDGVGGLFTYWRTSYEARDHHYALSRIPEVVRLLLGKLNFVLWKRSADVPQPARNTRPPNARWSQLKEPFFYMVFKDGDYLNYWPYDYDLRRSSEGGRRDLEDRIEEFRDIPEIPASREDLEDLDEILANAILAYQDGITESSVHQSFFAFWRGLENLAQVERGKKNEAVVDQGIFALENMTEKGVVRRELQEAIEEIYDKRNELVHQGPHTGISRYHRAAAKILLDVFLELYFTYYDDFDVEDYSRLLEYGTKTPEEREITKDTLDIIEALEDTE